MCSQELVIGVHGWYAEFLLKVSTNFSMIFVRQIRPAVVAEWLKLSLKLKKKCCLRPRFKYPSGHVVMMEKIVNKQQLQPTQQGRQCPSLESPVKLKVRFR